MRFHRKRHASSVPWPFEIVITQKRKTHPSALPWLLMGKRAMDSDVEGAREPTEATSRLWHWVGHGWWGRVLWLFFQHGDESKNLDCSAEKCHGVVAY